VDRFLKLDDGKKIFTNYNTIKDLPDLIDHVKGVTYDENKLFAGLYLACFMKEKGVPQCNDNYVKLALDLNMDVLQMYHLKIIEQFYPKTSYTPLLFRSPSNGCKVKNLATNEYIYIDKTLVSAYTRATNVGDGTWIQFNAKEGDQFTFVLSLNGDCTGLKQYENVLYGIFNCDFYGNVYVRLDLLENCYYQITYGSKVLTSTNELHESKSDMHELAFRDAKSILDEKMAKWIIEC